MQYVYLGLFILFMLITGALIALSVIYSGYIMIPAGVTTILMIFFYLLYNAASFKAKYQGGSYSSLDYY